MERARSSQWASRRRRRGSTLQAALWSGGGEVLLLNATAEPLHTVCFFVTKERDGQSATAEAEWRHSAACQIGVESAPLGPRRAIEVLFELGGLLRLPRHGFALHLPLNERPLPRCGCGGEREAQRVVSAAGGRERIANVLGCRCRRVRIQQLCPRVQYKARRARTLGAE